MVTVVRAGPSGGSGEIELNWGTVAGATGYRVYHATASDGPFSIAADYDGASATSTKASGVMNVYYTAEEGFVLIEVISDDAHSRRYYRVAAYNPAGEGASSAIVCGVPPGYPSC